MTRPLIARIVLGLIFTANGLNGFFGFLPAAEFPEAASTFYGAMLGTGYLFPLLKLTEAVCGILLLANRMVPLALTILAPVVLNILLFHLFLASSPALLVVPVLAAVLVVYLAYTYRRYFQGVLTIHASPGRVQEEVMA